MLCSCTYYVLTPQVELFLRAKIPTTKLKNTDRPTHHCTKPTTATTVNPSKHPVACAGVIKYLSQSGGTIFEFLGQLLLKFCLYLFETRRRRRAALMCQPL